VDTTLVKTSGVALTDAGYHDAQDAAHVLPLRALSTNRWAVAAVIAVPAVWVDLFVLARTIDRAWVWVAAWIGQALAVFGAGVLIRRAAAGQLFSTYRMNRVVGHFLGAVLLLPYTLFAEQHRTARLAARREDGSRWAIDGRARTGLAVDADRSRLGGYRSWHEAVQILAGEKHTESHSQVQIRSALLSVVTCAWMLTVAAIGLRFDTVAWLTSWLVPLLVGTTATFVVGAMTRRRRERLDRTTNAFEIVATPIPQEILPASRSWAISAGS
jgi:hypothetical protein